AELVIEEDDLQDLAILGTLGEVDDERQALEIGMCPQPDLEQQIDLVCRDPVLMLGLEAVPGIIDAALHLAALEREIDLVARLVAGDDGELHAEQAMEE